MDSIEIIGTAKVPAVIMDATLGLIELKGRSIPESSTKFYDPLFDWVEKYCKSPSKQTVVNVNLEYFNSGSFKCILKILAKLESIHTVSSDVVVNWYYEEDDEDMLEACEVFRSIVRLPFKEIVIEL